MMITIEDVDLKMSEFRTLSVPTFDEYEQDYDWIYYRYKVIVKVECDDGTFFVVVKDDSEHQRYLEEMEEICESEH